MKYLLFFLLSFTLVSGHSEDFNGEVRLPSHKNLHINKTKIMVIDTGFRVNSYERRYLCKRGHKSFIHGHRAFSDAHGHGTNVARLIMQGMDPKKHCLIIVKFWDKQMKADTMELVRMALQYALEIRPDYINMSLGGPAFNHSEMLSIKKLLKLGTKIAVAAGNEDNDLDKNCTFFPACYKIYHENFRVVGSTNNGIRPYLRVVRTRDLPKKKKPRIQIIKKINGKLYEIYSYTNIGKRVTHWENGTNKGTPQMTGTSQSTAISMSKWIQE